jgi:hypothetical protein
MSWPQLDQGTVESGSHDVDPHATGPGWPSTKSPTSSATARPTTRASPLPRIIGMRSQGEPEIAIELGETRYEGVTWVTRRQLASSQLIGCLS